MLVLRNTRALLQAVVFTVSGLGVCLRFIPFGTSKHRADNEGLGFRDPHRLKPPGWEGGSCNSLRYGPCFLGVRPF